MFIYNLGGVREKRHGPAWSKEGIGTRQSKVEGLDMWKPSNPCIHGKTDVKPMMMMMVMKRWIGPSKIKSRRRIKNCNL